MRLAARAPAPGGMLRFWNRSILQSPRSLHSESPRLTARATDDASSMPAGPGQFRRPPWHLSVAIDSALALALYLASYWLRFSRAQLSIFLPAAWSTAPWVVSGQVLLLAAARA